MTLKNNKNRLNILALYFSPIKIAFLFFEKFFQSSIQIIKDLNYNLIL